MHAGLALFAKDFDLDFGAIDGAGGGQEALRQRFAGMMREAARGGRANAGWLQVRSTIPRGSSHGDS